MITLDTLPNELILGISNYCDFDGVKELSFVSPSLNKLIRIRSLDLPTTRGRSDEEETTTTVDEFAILKGEVRTLFYRRIKERGFMKRNTTMIEKSEENFATAIAATGNATTSTNNQMLTSDAKICSAFFSRYGIDKRIIHARKIVKSHIHPDNHPYWKFCRTIDVLFLLLLNENEEDDTYFYLYYWDNRDGSHWQG